MGTPPTDDMFARFGILCPFCPKCGAPPAVVAMKMAQWFCSNDDCDVLCWDWQATATENLADMHPATIDTNDPE